MRFSCSNIPKALSVAILLCSAATAHATCQRNGTADGALDLIVDMPNLDLPNIRYTGSPSNAFDAFTCTPGPEEMLIDMPMSGLTYVRDIFYETQNYPAYQTSPRSPLLIFNHTIGDLSGGNFQRTPLRAGEVNRATFSAAVPGLYVSTVNAYVFFRGGAMESIPATVLGTIEAWSQSDPGNRVRHSLSLQVTVPVLTCTLSATDHILDDVPANDLATAGDTAKESVMGVSMNCPSANVDVGLTMEDANASGGTDGVLAPASGTTAGGVQIQVLHGGAPVQFGRRWDRGYSLKGVQMIPFTTRYLRMPAAVVPGLVKGEAVLTADYR